MQFYYGEQNILRALDEAEFWKHQETEHTTVIQLVTPHLEPQYILKLEQFGEEFSRMHAELVQYVESMTRSKGMVTREMKMQMLHIIKAGLKQSKEFVAFLEEMLQSSHAVRSNQSSQTVIHHIIRESQYFIGIDQLILS